MPEPLCNRVAIDLETTGLNPNAHSILEVGIQILDPLSIGRAMPLYEARFLVKYDSSSAVDLERQRANACIVDMHDKNNLWRDLAYAADHGTSESGELAAPIEKLDELCAAIIAKYAPELPDPRKPGKTIKPCCFGNNVESLDIPFLRAEMPKTAAMLHYRSINVSVLRGIVLAEKGRDFFDEHPGESGHRVLSDLIDAAHCYRWCVDVLQGRA
jgi:oligoribonuclease (3'-5' exoribonuclease)